MSSIKAYPASIDALAPHPNADKLQLATVKGYQIVVSLNYNVGDVGILFLPDAIIKQEVIDKYELAYLKNNRVRVVKLRGEWSDGLFINTSQHGTMDLAIEDMWEEYIPKPQNLSNGQQVKQMKGADKLRTVVPKHMDTQQYLANKSKIESMIAAGWNPIYTVKTHGTSGISALVKKPIRVPYTKAEQFISKLAGYFRLYTKYMRYLETKYENAVEDYYSYVTSSRNVFIDPDEDNFRNSITTALAFDLKEGMVIYYEILGYDHNGSPIMEPYKGQAYDYGCGTYAIQVYRITQDGRELTWKEMEAWSEETYIPLVKRLDAGSIEEAFQKSLEQTECEMYAPKIDTVMVREYNHTNEGLVIRLEHPETTDIALFKYKGREFLQQEGILPQQSDT